MAYHTGNLGLMASHLRKDFYLSFAFNALGDDGEFRFRRSSITMAAMCPADRLIEFRNKILIYLQTINRQAACK